MLDPAPTTRIDPELTRARLAEVHDATATKPAFAVLEVDNADYRLRLEFPKGKIPDGFAELVGSRVVGTIRACANRVDVVRSGGKFIDPVFGRPRRVQGRVIATNPSGGTITIHAGVPLVCKITAPGQKAGDFEPMSFVSCDVQRGATFEAAE